MARAAIQTIAANTAINDVVAITAIYGVFATKSAKRVISGATIKIIGALCSCKLTVYSFS
jgi:hypothetical protein